MQLSMIKARNDTKDKTDAITLMKHLDIASVDEALSMVERDMPKNMLTPNVKYFAMEAFDEYVAAVEQCKNDIDAFIAQRQNPDKLPEITKACDNTQKPAYDVGIKKETEDYKER